MEIAVLTGRGTESEWALADSHIRRRDLLAPQEFMPVPSKGRLASRGAGRGRICGAVLRGRQTPIGAPGIVDTLIADDEMLARAHLRRMLEAQGETVVGEAEDVADLLKKAIDLRPDLIFLDIRMPGASGMEAAAALHALQNPPLIVFVTGYSEHALAAFERNAMDYLLKPVAPERLAKSLERARERLSDRGRRPPQEQTGSRQNAPLARL
ncbi:MAG TPA: response regulator, partial [Chthonomonadaceae bacterium]|nr:response regulator [Chthonomonadaceae bacterium]